MFVVCCVPPVVCAAPVACLRPACYLAARRAHRDNDTQLQNPHSAQVDDLDIFAIGPQFESNAVFPARTNTEFVEVGSLT